MPGSGTGRYVVETEFRLIDDISKKMEKIGLSGTLLKKTLGVSLLRAEEDWKKLGAAVGKAAVAIGTAAVGAAVGATKKYIEFEDVLTKAGSKFVDLDVTSATYQEDLEALSKAAQQVGAVTKYTASDAAGALDKMAMAGLSSGQAIGMLMGTTNLATAAGLDLTSAVDMATDAMGAFNLMKDEAGNPLDEAGIAKSMNRVADVVAKVTNMANLDMNMWFEAAKYGAATFTSLGGQIEEFSAMAGLLANAGIKGSMAGNEIKNMMLNLSAPVAKGSKALSALGIQVFDAQGQMNSFTNILGQFEKALDGMADEEKASLLKDIFGKEQIGAFNILLSSGTKELERYTTTLENAGGVANDIARAQEKSLAGQFAALGSALEAKQLQFGEAIKKAGGLKVLEKFIELIQKFDFAPIVGVLSAAAEKAGEVILGTIDYLKENLGEAINFQNITESIKAFDISSIVRGLGDFIVTLKETMGFLMEHSDLIFTLAKAWLKYRGAMMIAVPVVKTASTIKTLADVSITTFGAIKDGVTIASKSLQGLSSSAQLASQMATPLGRAFGSAFTTIGKAGQILQTALSTMGAAIVGFFATVKTTLVGFFVTMGGAIKTFCTTTIAPLLANPITWIVLAVILVLASLISMIVMVVKHFDELTEAFNNAGGGAWGFRDAVDTLFQKFDEIGGIGGAILKFLVQPFKYVWELVRGIIDIVQAFISGGFINGIKMIGLKILEFIASPIQAILDMISLIPGINIGDSFRGWFEDKRNDLLGKNDNKTNATGSDLIKADTVQIAATNPIPFSEMGKMTASPIIMPFPTAENGNAGMTDFSYLDNKQSQEYMRAEPVNQRTVTENYNENNARLDIFMDEKLSGNLTGAMSAPNITLNTGRKAS